MQLRCIFSITAIKSLDNLKVHYLKGNLSPNSQDLGDNELSPHDRESLQSSIAKMRGHLVDAQSNFRKMVQDNKLLTARIESSIHSANEEVRSFRAELSDANQRLSQISENPSSEDYQTQLIMTSDCEC